MSTPISPICEQCTLLHEPAGRAVSREFTQDQRTIATTPLATICCQRLLSPKYGVKIGCKFFHTFKLKFPLTFGLKPPPLPLGSLLRVYIALWKIGGSCVICIVCSVKYIGQILIYILSKTFSPIFHWAQAAPTKLGIEDAVCSGLFVQHAGHPNPQPSKDYSTSRTICATSPYKIEGRQRILLCELLSN